MKGILVAGLAALLLAVPRVEAGVLKSLRSGHPRLIVLKEDVARLKRAVRKPGEEKDAFARLYVEAERLLGAPPVRYEIPDGLRLLRTSRECMNRMYLLGFVWRMTGEERFAERAFKDLEAAAGFPDWNPRHFLDTAEMSHAFGIGYDWLYDFLTPERRKFVRGVLVEKGIGPYLAGVANKAWWWKSHANWGQVTNGGVGVAALALGGEEPELASEVLERAFEGIPKSLAAYAPDGGIPEGPGYWHYATMYTVFFLAALETALGEDGGLSESPGFPETGFFRIHAEGPIGLSFNYADAHDRAGRCDEMFWLARRFRRPEFASHSRAANDRPSVLSLVWGSRAGGKGNEHRELPRDAWFKGVNVVFLRSAWDDPKAVYVGFKGGDNTASHGHLDLGSFVLDALGRRWALDLGPDNYNLPAYFGSKRWTYFRLKTESHNTILLDGENQDPGAVAPVIAFFSSPERSHAVVDLTRAYGSLATGVRRGVALLDRSRVLVQDEVQCAETRRLDWLLYTPAAIRTDGRRAELALEGEKLLAEILEPGEAVFSQSPVAARPSENPIGGISRLAATVEPVRGKVRVAVLLTPGAGLEDPGKNPPEIEPLEAWAGRK